MWKFAGSLFIHNVKFIKHTFPFLLDLAANARSDLGNAIFIKCFTALTYTTLKVS